MAELRQTSADARDISLLQQETGKQEGIASVQTATALLCVLSLGVGVFAMPSVMNDVGIIVGSTMIVVFGLVSTALMLACITIIKEKEVNSWEELVGLIPGGIFASRLSLVAALMTGNAAHLQFVAGMLFDLISYFVTNDYGQYEFSNVHKLTLLFIFLGITLPYTFQESTHHLEYISRSVAGTVIVSCIAVVFFSLMHVAEHGVPSGDEATPLAPTSVKSVFTSMSTIAFAFTSMCSLFDTYDQVKRADEDSGASEKRMRRAITLAGVIVTCIYFCVCLVCVLAFGTKAGQTAKGNGSGNALYNFPADNYPVTFLCLALVIVIVLDYAILMWPAVNTLLKTLPSPAEASPWKPTYQAYARAVCNVICAVIIVVVVMVVPDLTDVFGLCGALGVSVYCYLLPGLVVARCHSEFMGKLIGVISALLGSTMLILSSTFIFEHIATGDN